MGKFRFAALLAASFAFAFALAGCAGNAAESGSAATESSSTAVGSSAASGESSAAAQGKAMILVNTEGMGVISWAYEGEEVEFDDDMPYQSAVINDAYGQTISIEARDYEEYEGWHFAKWTKDGADFSTDNRIDVPVDGDTEYIAVFEFAEE